MADQDGLVQVGSELTLEELVAQDITIPVGSAPDRGGSALLSAPPFDMSQMMEMLINKMDANLQRMEKRMDVNTQVLRGDMQNVVRNFANGTTTLREEITESRGSVDVVRTAMTTGEVEATSEVTIIGGETGKLGQGMTEIKKETQELKEVTDAGFRNNNRNARIRRERRIARN